MGHNKEKEHHKDIFEHNKEAEKYFEGIPGWWKSKKWQVYLIPEKVLKFYDGMDLQKVRPCVVINNDADLFNKSIVLECTTKSYPGYIKIDGLKHPSYIAVDRIQTVDNKYLSDDHLISGVHVPDATKKAIVDWWVNKLLDLVPENQDVEQKENINNLKDVFEKK